MIRHCDLCMLAAERHRKPENGWGVSEAKKEPWWFKWDTYEPGGSFSGMYFLCEDHILRGGDHVNELRSLAQGWFALEILHRGSWGQVCEGSFHYCLGFRDARAQFGPMGEWEDETRIVERIAKK